MVKRDSNYKYHMEPKDLCTQSDEGFISHRLYTRACAEDNNVCGVGSLQLLLDVTPLSYAIGFSFHCIVLKTWRHFGRLPHVHSARGSLK